MPSYIHTYIHTQHAGRARHAFDAWPAAATDGGCRSEPNRAFWWERGPSGAEGPPKGPLGRIDDMHLCPSCRGDGTGSVANRSSRCHHVPAYTRKSWRCRDRGDGSIKSALRIVNVISDGVFRSGGPRIYDLHRQARRPPRYAQHHPSVKWFASPA
ncbi:hypothetical protein BDY21DRAFT_196563 [Lineolata rhizophorae]|uniref:Uncharacterized protein n=1 Tax=Lineolata rhizophorae TaxID=578093 RepID=A0A6A6P566_9PEZI|nr:hypothetical protein BDY21DRAFT_196563 [Lineolata rhizophorae]